LFYLALSIGVPAVLIAASKFDNPYFFRVRFQFIELASDLKNNALTLTFTVSSPAFQIIELFDRPSVDRIGCQGSQLN
jgi:hypothetical protein